MTIARSSARPAAVAAADGRLPPVAELHEAGVAIGATPILSAIGLRLRAGEVVGLVGPNGAGKTTLLRLLATLVPLAAGRGTVLGADLQDRSASSVRRRIAYLGHEAALHPSLSLRENLQLLGGQHRRDAERVEAILDLVGLVGAGDRPAHDCSRGMVRRAEIGRALLLEPRLLLLDEAHAGLDMASMGLVRLLLDDVRSRHGAAVVVSHDIGRLDPIVDRVMGLQAGRITGAAV